MLISLSWLKKYVQIPDDTKDFVEDLTMAGLNVERTIEEGYSDPAIVVGHVLEVSDHPDADKLRVCRVKVDADSERVIVCGAPNVGAGQDVLVALPGAQLPDGMKIRRAKIRGVKSDGMICSEQELGLGSDASGIMVLDGDFSPGTPMTEVLPPPDTVLEIEVTPNRPDQLSHIGVAREVAAIYKTALELPYGTASQERAAQGREDFKVTIEDSADCARYVGLRVSGVRVGPSPAWLANALESVGLKSINNIVDVSNFVLMELGQPIHTFDFELLKGGHVIVRRAQDGERILGLDGIKHELRGDMLVIADSKEPVALAGVIGGEDSAVHADTVEVLIESANFDPRLVRRTRSALGISTDASYRFERGADREMCGIAAQRAADLICEVAGGERGHIVDAYPGTNERQTLSIRRAATRRILGAKLGIGEIEELLARLGFEAADRTEEALQVVVPSHRLDIEEEIDLIEEVARLYGYDRIGTGSRFRCTTWAESDPLGDFIEALSDHLSARGFSEVVASSFTDGRELEDFGWSPNDLRSRPIAIRNPLNVNHKYLKTSLLPGMLDIMRRNLDHGARRLRIYQMGRTFLAPEGANQLPDEKNILCMAITGPDSKDFWYDSKGAPDLFDIKRELEVMMEAFKVDLGSDVSYSFDRSTGQFQYTYEKVPFIEGGIISDAIAARYDFEQAVWYVNLDLGRLYKYRVTRPKLKPLLEYPISKRDLSLMAKTGIEFDKIEKSLVKSAGRLLESLQVFDVYRGDQIQADHTAYGVRLNFRSSERTLTDAEVDQIIDKILGKLKNELGVELRS